MKTNRKSHTAYGEIQGRQESNGHWYCVVRIYDYNSAAVLFAHTTKLVAIYEDALKEAKSLIADKLTDFEITEDAHNGTRI